MIKYKLNSDLDRVVGMVVSVLRYYHAYLPLLREKGLSDDLSQEIYCIAFEAHKASCEGKQILKLANKRLREFLKLNLNLRETRRRGRYKRVQIITYLSEIEKPNSRRTINDAPLG